MKKILITALVFAAACDSPTVPERFLRDVYDFRLITPDPLVLRWPAGSTVKLFVVADADATRTGYLRAAVEHGMRVWNTAALYGEVQLAETTTLGDADVVVQYSQSESPVDLSACAPGGGLAYTTFCLTGDEDHLLPFPLKAGGDSGVKFVLTVRTLSTTDEVTVRRLVSHELGHVLGIAQHSPKLTDLMYAGTLNRDEPSAADRHTLQLLYHTDADITP